MDEEQEVEEIVEEEQEVVEEQHEEIQEEVNEAEEKALKMGWVPQDKFKGDPDKWRPAEEFVERGEKMIPILNAKIRRLEEQQQTKEEGYKKYLDDLREKLHAREVQEYEERKRQAVREGDEEAYDRLSRETPVNDIPEYEVPQPKEDPVFTEWKAENDWFVNDFEKHDEARRYSEFLDSNKPELKGREYLDAISTHIGKKFQNPNRQRASAVDGGTPKARSKSGKLYSRLSEEAKAQFNSFVRQGVFTNTDVDKEAYAKDVS